MFENRPKDALDLLVETVETVETVKPDADSFGTYD